VDNLPKPTEAELEILGVLWKRGPSTVRQVYEAFTDAKQTGYTTTLKLMQIMAEKGLLKRDESERAHVYEPGLPQAQTRKRLVDDLVDRAFSGSAAGLVLQALSGRRATAAELDEIRTLLDGMEKE
jgi:BlaI family transcriptional regulator, penicillinase repressor